VEGGDGLLILEVWRIKRIYVVLSQCSFLWRIYFRIIFFEIPSTYKKVAAFISNRNHGQRRRR
jgi:hypothetical protein